MHQRETDPAHDFEHAYEIKHQSKRYAWTEDDNVYVHDPQHSDREDGFVFVGKLAWLDEEQANNALLRIYLDRNT
jgi:hypothetical protein